MTLWLRGLVRSHDKLKTLYHHYHNVWRHQIQHCDDLEWQASIHKVTWKIKQVDFLRSCDRLKPLYLHYHNVCRYKRDSVRLYNEDLPSIKSHDLLITRSCKVFWQTKYVTSSLLQGQWLLNLASWGLTMMDFHS